MLARSRWQVRTIQALEIVFEERCRQMELHGAAMRTLPDGTGPEVNWIPGVAADALTIQEMFRHEYDRASKDGELTRMHLVREELAELFELRGDDPDFIAEASQVAALLVQLIEYKLEDRENTEQN